MVASEQAPGLSSIRRTVIDGVPTFWIEAEGPCYAGLVFRVGQADETVSTRGVSHLVEHLAMGTVGEPPYGCNAAVGMSTATFWARGSAEEIGSFLQTVCAGLSNLPADRTGLEARVLRTEAVGRSLGPVPRMAWLRYGFTGLALSWLPEYFLNDPQPERVVEWAASRFTGGNCVLWVVGRLPDGLRLPLPAGPRYPLPVSRQIPGLPLPAALGGDDECISIGFESERTSTSTTVIRIAANRLRTQVRHERGLTYQVAGDREPLSTTRAHNMLWLTCLEEQAEAVQTELLNILGDLAAGGPTEQELADDLTAFMRQGTDPDGRVQDVAAAAEYELVGMPASGFADLVEERRAVTAAGCATELEAMLATAILNGARVSSQHLPPGFNLYPTTCPPLAGRVFRPVSARWPWEKTNVVIVGPDGISYATPNGRAASVRWADCVALVLRNDGTRTVLGSDGFSVELKPGAWKEGSDLVRLVDQAIPNSLRVGPAV
jgi:hypothetical protein